jgi:hypothetical protein
LAQAVHLSAADAAGHFGRDQARARTEKRVIDQLAGSVVVDDRIASNQGPVGHHALVTCSPILLHSSMSQVATYLKGWSTLGVNNSKTESLRSGLFH